MWIERFYLQLQGTLVDVLLNPKEPCIQKLNSWVTL